MKNHLQKGNVLQQFRNLAIRRLGQSQSTQIFKRKKGNPNLTPKYCWKRDNPDSEDFFLAKCAAVNYRRAQHVKEYIYEEDIKEGLCSKLQKSPARERIHIRRGY